MTDNHEYETPAQGAQDWHVPLNDNFEALDTDVEVRDAESNLGDYQPKAGAKFLATDTEVVYIGDGSNWTEFATSGTDPSFDVLNPSGNFLGVGRSSRVTNREFFGVGATVKAGDYGGMYVDAADPDARPFYGYATDGGVGVYHYYDGQTGDWSLREPSGTRLTVDDNGKVGVGTTDPGRTKLSVNAEGEDSYGISTRWSGPSLGAALLAENTGAAGDAIQAIATDGRSALRATSEGSALAIQTQGDVDIGGTLSASSKNFVHPVETDDGEREVVYTSVEAGTPTTEASGVAELDDGEAVVDLPEHFAWVTDPDEPLVVQVTPHAREPVRPQVVERSTHRIVVRDFEGVDAYEVSYTVRGTREGYADQEVVREPETPGDHEGE